ncbi:hypothetical protein BJY52DRAFT_1423314 [Lactarius psammicola]|nr:hypothetical protein BJY52DRAFT_1423314 [Lactarius psammicola]
MSRMLLDATATSHHSLYPPVFPDVDSRHRLSQIAWVNAVPAPFSYLQPTPAPPGRRSHILYFLSCARKDIKGRAKKVEVYGVLLRLRLREPRSQDYVISASLKRSQLMDEVVHQATDTSSDEDQGSLGVVEGVDMLSAGEDSDDDFDRKSTSEEGAGEDSEIKPMVMDIDAGTQGVVAANRSTSCPRPVMHGPIRKTPPRKSRLN